MSRYAVQLYSLRHRPEPITGLIREAAGAGFSGVEFADRMQQTDPHQVRAALSGTGISPVGMHVDLSTLNDSRDEIISRCTIIGCDRIVIPHIPIERFNTAEKARSLAEELSTLADTLAPINVLVHTTRELLLPFIAVRGIGTIMERDGLPRGVYNHLAWVSAKSRARTATTLREQTPFGILADMAPNIAFEVDTKSALTAGYDLDLLLETFPTQIPLIHVSDVSRVRVFPPDYQSVLPGDGLLDLDTTLKSTESAKWVIAEHDDPADPELVLTELADCIDVNTTPSPIVQS